MYLVLEEWNIMKITDDVYNLDSTEGNYAYLILGEEVIMIDTGRPGQGEGILNELESLNIKPGDIKHILITHLDIDHIGNAALLEKATGATLWASKEDIPYINGDKKPPGIRRFFSLFMKADKPKNITPYTENQKIDGIEVVTTPGHTPGHVCLIYKDVLFAGDLVRNSKGQLKPQMSFINWNDEALKQSIKELDKYPFKWVCPAHGEPVKRDPKWEELLK